jgi:predicted nucleic acid-binding protein
MSAPVFVDTNVLVYADDRGEPEKQRDAQNLINRVLAGNTGRVSLQVLQEYVAVATRKLKMDAAIVRRRVELYRAFDIVKLDSDDLLAAIDLHRLHLFSIWDALIVRAALIAGCRKLYTEDLQPGFRIEKLEIVNPFV